MDFSKYSKQQLGKAYEDIIGYNPFEDSPDITVYEVAGLMKGYDKEAIKEHEQTFADYFKNIDSQSAIGRSAILEAGFIEDASDKNQSSAIKKYRKDVRKYINQVGVITAETIGLFTIKFGNKSIKVPRHWVQVLPEIMEKGGGVSSRKSSWTDDKTTFIKTMEDVNSVADAKRIANQEKSIKTGDLVVVVANGISYKFTKEKTGLEFNGRVLGDISYEKGGAVKIPNNVFYVKIKPLKEGQSPIYARISPDSVGAFVAGYVLYNNISSKRKSGYLKRDQLMELISSGDYTIVPKEEAVLHLSQFERGGEISGTRNKYEEYLNELGIPEGDAKSDGGRIPDNAKYGSWLRKNDKIAFNVGYNDWTREHSDRYQEGGEISGQYEKGGRASSGEEKMPEKGTPEWHQLQIAKKTLSYSDSGAMIMGGMTKEEAKKILKKYGLNPDKFEEDGFLNDNDELNITAFQQHICPRIRKYLKEYAPNLEVWKNLSIRDKNTNHVYRVDSYLYQRIGGKLRGVVLRYVHGQNEESFGEISVDFKINGVTYDFPSLGLNIREQREETKEKFDVGGNVSSYDFKINGKSIYEYLKGLFPAEDQEVLSATEKLIKEYFISAKKNYGHPNYGKLSAPDVSREMFADKTLNPNDIQVYNLAIKALDNANTVRAIPNKFAQGGTASGQSMYEQGGFVDKFNTALGQALYFIDNSTNFSTRLIKSGRTRSSEKYSILDEAGKQFKELDRLGVIDFAKEQGMKFEGGGRVENPDVYFKDEGDFIQVIFMSSAAKERAKKQMLRANEANGWKMAVDARMAYAIKYSCKKNWNLSVDDSEIDYDEYAAGGKVSFSDKVDAISNKLEGTQVPSKYRKDYGKTYSHKDAETAARRIAGAMVRDEKMESGGAVHESKKSVLRVRPEYKYQNIGKRWLDDNSSESTKYKLAVLLLKNEKNPDEILKLENSQYDRLLRSLDSIQGSKHEMAWRTLQYSTGEAEQWARESLKDIFYLDNKDEKILPEEYYKTFRLRGNGRRQYNIFQSHSDSELRQAVRQLFPGMTHDEHKTKAADYLKRAIEVAKKWVAVKDKAGKELLGEEYRGIIHDKVSGIGRDEFPEEVKEELRSLIKQMNEYEDASRLHNAMLLSKDKIRSYDLYAEGGTVHSVSPGDRIAFKDTGSVIKTNKENDDITVRDASGNIQAIPRSRILEKFKHGGIMTK